MLDEMIAAHLYRPTQTAGDDMRSVVYLINQKIFEVIDQPEQVQLLTDILNSIKLLSSPASSEALN